MNNYAFKDMYRPGGFIPNSQTANLKFHTDKHTSYVVPIARLETFRDLTLSGLDSCMVLNSISLIGGFEGPQLS
jgi:hypothetical protein